ncbi:hypothetical protein [Aquirufa aurantiipilula]|uniref:hypothetical protein n=1 Tax=Aquirufa aurantiipilula TaxID=2696561 RepID=UPI001CAA52DB|nr:hypothetical protein [Aquirufa aurantiipilula]
MVAKLENLDFKNGKSFVSFPADEIEGLSIKEIMEKYEAGKFSANILDGFRKKIFAERDILVKDVLNFYTTKLHFKNKESALTPEDIYLLIEAKKTRLKRLIMVIEPDFYPTITKKSNGDEYDLVKLNWIGDDGLKFIKVSKTFGQKGELGLEFSMKKVINDYFTTEAQQSTDWKLKQSFARSLRADHVASVDGKTWVFEFKLTDKKEFIKTALRFELWDMYFQTYLNKPEKEFLVPYYSPIIEK